MSSIRQICQVYIELRLHVLKNPKSAVLKISKKKQKEKESDFLGLTKVFVAEKG